MKKYVFVLFCVFASGCTVNTETIGQIRDENEASLRRYLTQERIASELTHIRKILERAMPKQVERNTQ